MIMKKNTLFLFAVVLAITSFSSCGIFSKGCGCPTFGKIKSHSSPIVIASAKATAVKAG